MNTRNLILGAIAVAFVGWLVFGPEEEDTKTGEGSESASERDFQSQPREPVPLAPPQRHGIADGGPAGTGLGYGGSAPYYRGPPPVQPPAYRPAQPQLDPMERFSFRPLTDRERERLSRERPEDDYGMPSEPPSAPISAWSPVQPYIPAQPRPYAPAPSYDYSQRYVPTPPYGYPYAGADQKGPSHYGSPPGHASEPAYGQPAPYSGWQDQGYRFRAYESAPAAGDRWQSPYPGPGWDRAPELADPWATPPGPRSGSAPRGWTPPAERMYPALDWGPDQKLTARD